MADGSCRTASSNIDRILSGRAATPGPALVVKLLAIGEIDGQWNSSSSMVTHVGIGRFGRRYQRRFSGRNDRPPAMSQSSPILPETPVPPRRSSMYWTGLLVVMATISVGWLVVHQLQQPKFDEIGLAITEDRLADAEAALKLDRGWRIIRAIRLHS